MRLSAEQKFYITLLIALVATGLMIYFLPYRIFLQIKSSSARLAQARLEVSSADQRLESAKRQEALLLSRQSELSEVRENFFSHSDELRIVEVVESIAKASGVRAQNDVLGTDKNTINLRLSVVGSYVRVSNFVSLIENAPLYFEVQNYWLERMTAVKDEATLSAAKSATSPAELRATLTVKVYSVD